MQRIKARRLDCKRTPAFTIRVHQCMLISQLPENSLNTIIFATTTLIRISSTPDMTGCTATVDLADPRLLTKIDKFFELGIGEYVALPQVR